MCLALSAQGGYLISQSLSFVRSLTSLDLSHNPLTKYSVNCCLEGLNGDYPAFFTNLKFDGSFVAPRGTSAVVPNLDSTSYDLTLSDHYDHCVAEILRAKTLRHHLPSTAHIDRFSFKGERAKRASLDDDEHTRYESRETVTDIMATSTTKLTHSIRLARLVRSCFIKNAPRFARRRVLRSVP